jgi:uncharacterized membrane protein
MSLDLNNELEQASEPDSIAGIGAVRDDLYGPWVAWNIIRTLATTAAPGCLAYALLLRGRAASTT